MAVTTTFGNKAAAAALVALTLGASLTLQSSEAEARFRHRGGLIAAGVIGALAVGALAASAHNAHAAPGYYADPGYDYVPQPVYHQPQPVYYQEQPTYYQEQPAYGYHRPHHGYGYRQAHRNRYPGYSETSMAYKGPRCKLVRQPYFDGYGYRTQKVQVCR